jgi:hypothetical protein
VWVAAQGNLCQHSRDMFVGVCCSCAQVRAKEEKGFVNAPPPTPAAQAMRVAQERSWVQQPPSTPAVKTIRSEQDGVHVPVHESSAKQVRRLCRCLVGAYDASWLTVTVTVATRLLGPAPSAMVCVGGKWAQNQRK